MPVITYKANRIQTIFSAIYMFNIKLHSLLVIVMFMVANHSDRIINRTHVLTASAVRKLQTNKSVYCVFCVICRRDFLFDI